MCLVNCEMEWKLPWLKIILLQEGGANLLPLRCLLLKPEALANFPPDQPLSQLESISRILPSPVISASLFSVSIFSETTIEPDQVKEDHLASGIINLCSQLSDCAWTQNFPISRLVWKGKFCAELVYVCSEGKETQSRYDDGGGGDAGFRGQVQRNRGHSDAGLRYSEQSEPIGG